jgi:hypothetical protein
MIKATPTHVSSPVVDQDLKPTSHRAVDSLIINMADESDDLQSATFSNEDTLADPSTGDITYSADRQQHDLLGLSLQTAINGLSNNETKAPNNSFHNTALQAVLGEKVAACPVHKTLLAGFHASAVTGGATTSEPKSKLMPMGRYLAEGLEERYALVSVSQSETGGEWARYYSACLCGQVSPEGSHFFA